MHETLKEGMFKKMRRALPVTGAKFDWDKPKLMLWQPSIYLLNKSIKTKISSSYNTKIIANNINIIDKW